MDTWKTVRHVSPSVILECFETFGRHFQPLSLSDKLEVCQKMVADLNRVRRGRKREILLFWRGRRRRALVNGIDGAIATLGLI